MGQQQLLLIILGVIIVGIAIAVGLSMFSAQSVQSNKDAIINDLNNLAANAYQFRIRPSSMGGGQGSYANYSIPVKLQTNANATYSLGTKDANTCIIIGTSGQYTTGGTVQATLDSNGNLGTWVYGTDFQ
jgi:hypothetical protein